MSRRDNEILETKLSRMLDKVIEKGDTDGVSKIIENMLSLNMNYVSEVTESGESLGYVCIKSHLYNGETIKVGRMYKIRKTSHGHEISIGNNTTIIDEEYMDNFILCEESEVPIRMYRFFDNLCNYISSKKIKPKLVVMREFDGHNFAKKISRLKIVNKFGLEVEARNGKGIEDFQPKQDEFYIVSARDSELFDKLFLLGSGAVLDHEDFGYIMNTTDKYMN